MNKKKYIWIFNHYATGMFDNKGGRHYWFAKYLKKAGYSPVIFCANVYHGTNKEIDTNGKLFVEKIDIENKIPFVFVKTTPYQGNGKSRIKNMISFYRNVKKVAKLYTKTHEKPDVLMGSSVHPLAIVAAIKVAKKYNVKCIGEVRDLWPESIVAYSTKWTQDNFLMKILYEGEKWIYKKVDSLIFTMEGGKDYVVEKGWDKEHGGPVDLDKVHHINNGIDLELFNYNKENFVFEDADLDNDSTFKVVYTGSIRQVNNIGILIDVAKILSERSDKIVIIIYGIGTQLKELKSKVTKLDLNNIVFKGSVEKKYIPYTLSKCDLNLMHAKTTSLFKYGLSANKSFDYLASGNPIFQNFIVNYDYVASNGCGISKEVKSIEEYAECILTFANLSILNYRKFCDNAKEVAKKFDVNVIGKKIKAIIDKL